MKTKHHSAVESSALFLRLSEETLQNLDLFFSNTDLTKKQQTELMEILKTIHDEGNAEGYSDGYENGLEAGR